jgi:hypothetical protein
MVRCQLKSTQIATHFVAIILQRLQLLLCEFTNAKTFNSVLHFSPAVHQSIKCVDRRWRWRTSTEANLQDTTAGLANKRSSGHVHIGWRLHDALKRCQMQSARSKIALCSSSEQASIKRRALYAIVTYILATIKTLSVLCEDVCIASDDASWRSLPFRVSNRSLQTWYSSQFI